MESVQKGPRSSMISAPPGARIELAKIVCGSSDLVRGLPNVCGELLLLCGNSYWNMSQGVRVAGEPGFAVDWSTSLHRSRGLAHSVVAEAFA